MKINGFDARRFERLVKSVHMITTDLLELQAQRRAAGLSSRAYSTWLLQGA